MRNLYKILILALELGPLQNSCSQDNNRQPISKISYELDTDKAYRLMDKYLKEKNISAFLSSYKQARELADRLLKGDNEDILKGISNKHAGRILLDNLVTGDYGAVYTRLIQYNQNTEWPKDCPSADSSSKNLVEDLVRFGRIRYAIRKGNVPERWDLDIIFDDKILAQQKQEGFETTPSVTYETGNNLPDGRYTTFGYNNAAQLFTFNMIDIDTPEPLGRKTTWLCDVVDLGADGIDACDAKINRISDIDSANKKYLDCLERTKTKLVSRYSKAQFSDK